MATFYVRSTCITCQVENCLTRKSHDIILLNAATKTSTRATASNDRQSYRERERERREEKNRRQISTCYECF